MMKRFVLVFFVFLIAFLISCKPKEAVGGGGAAAAGGSGKVTIELLQFKVDIKDRVMAMVDDFNKAQDKIFLDATVEGDEYNTIIQTRMAANTVPDIFFTRGYTDIIRTMSYLTDLTDQPWNKTLYDAGRSIEVNGKMYGMPVGLEGYGYIYNVDILKKAGVETDPAKMPKTVRELQALTQKLQSSGIKSYNEAYQEFYTIGRLFDNALSMMPNSRMFYEDVNSGKARIKDSKYLDGMFDIIDNAIQFGSGVESIGIPYESEIASFSSQENAMVFNGIWIEPSVRTITPTINMDMFPVPFTNDPADSRLPVDVPAAYSIYNKSRYPEEAKYFLNWLYDNGQKYLVESFLLIPAFSTMQVTPQMGTLAATINRHVAEGTSKSWALRPEGDYYVVLQEYVAGLKTRTQAIEEMQVIWDSGAK
jgi:raffinose/stachyose/melibiose transport system substrate-binding protein